jgi:hypothetical protein
MMVTDMARPRTWSDEELAAALAGASTWAGVTRALGVTPGGSAVRCAAGHAMRLGLDVSHLREVPAARPPARPAGPPPAAELAALVRDAGSWAQLLTALKVGTSGSRYRWARQIVADAGISTAHFRSRGARRGAREAEGARLLTE